MKPLCIYHGNCADGFGAAWAVRDALGEANVDFFAAFYGKQPPDVSGRQVIMVDFCYKAAVLRQMANSAQSILILDHHKSAAEELAGFPAPPPLPRGSGWLPEIGVFAWFDMDHSGAMLAWNHFHKSDAPPLLAHIEDRDLWRFALEDTREIQIALFSYPYNFAVWDKFMWDGEAGCAQLAMDGMAIQRKHMKDIAELRGLAERRMLILGHNVPVLNAPYFHSSEAGQQMAAGHPFAACYWDEPDGRAFSLRSAEDGMDVSAIAKRYGGGGHKHAAGFKIQYCQAAHHIAHPIHVFEVIDVLGPDSKRETYYAGVSREEIRECYVDDGAALIRQVSERELIERAVIGPDGVTRTFLDELMRRIASGDKFPQPFAEPLPEDAESPGLTASNPVTPPVIHS